MGSRLHFYRISGLGVGALVAVACAEPAGALAAATAPTLNTGRGCYVVGQAVRLRGSGFVPGRTYVVTIDGVYLGQRKTNAQGGFSIAVHPGGLPEGAAQHTDRLEVSDGVSSASATFTLTRRAGALILTSGGNPRTLSGRFLVWGYATGGAARAVYVHYISPTGAERRTVALGSTAGSCGYLRTRRRRIFPLPLSSGTWTLQLDTRRAYARHHRGPMTRIRVRIAG